MRIALATSYLTQVYIIIVSIAVMPLYLRQLGPEAFGLVGFYLMLQSWLQLLDFGLSPTFSREVARYKAGVGDGAVLRRYLYMLECLMVAMALCCVFGSWLTRQWIAFEWLKAEALQLADIASCIVMMVVACCLRWISGLYRSGLVGFERQSWVNGTLSFCTTVRFVGVIPVLIFSRPTVSVFFSYQVVASVLELFVFRTLLYRIMPKAGVSNIDVSFFMTLQRLLPMAGAMAFMSALWVVMTQLDKLLLSKLLTLSEYGHYTLGIIAAGGILFLVPPMNQVLQPRMTILAASGRELELRRFYQKVSQFSALMFAVLGGGVSIYAEPLLQIWTGSVEVSRVVGPILFWYGLSNMVIGLLVLPFMLQFARGSLRLHVIGNVIMAIALLPALILAVSKYGAVGAGKVLFGLHLLFLFLWVPLAHKSVMPEVVVRWLYRDLLPIIVSIIAMLYISSWFMPRDLNAFLSLVWIVLSLISAALIGSSFGTAIRQEVWGFMMRSDV